MPLPDFDKLWNYNEPAATEQRFRELLPEALASGDTSHRLQLLTQIARTQGLQNQFNDAHATLDAVERELTPELRLARVRYLLERGRVFNSSTKRPEARTRFLEAFELAVAGKLDYFAIDAAHMLGIAEETPEKQLRWNERALEMIEKSDDPRAKRWAGPLYNNLGWTYFDLKQYERALELFRKGVDFRSLTPGEPRELRIARYCVGKTYRAMGRIDDALLSIKPVYDEAVGANDPDGFFAEELAECLLAKGDAEGAKPLFARAHEVLSKDEWFVKNESARLARMAELANSK